MSTFYLLARNPYVFDRARVTNTEFFVLVLSRPGQKNTWICSVLGVDTSDALRDEAPHRRARGGKALEVRDLVDFIPALDVEPGGENRSNGSTGAQSPS